MKATPITFKASAPTKMAYNSGLVSGAYNSAKGFQDTGADLEKGMKPKSKLKEELEIEPEVEVTDPTEEGGGDGENMNNKPPTDLDPNNEVEGAVAGELINLNNE